jgi:hypothetical protein
MLKKQGVTTPVESILQICGRCHKTTVVTYDSTLEPLIRICKDCKLLEGGTIDEPTTPSSG